MTGYTVNNRGRYKCDFCDHRTYKTVAGILTHVQKTHELELERAVSDDLRRRLELAKNQPPKVVTKERVVYRDPPEPKKPEYWYPTGLYCQTCKIAMSRAGIPRGQTVDNTPHSVCGTRSLLLITEFQ